MNKRDLELLLNTGEDIPFLEAQLVIRQPTIREIGVIGEENLWIGCELLSFSKEILNQKDRENLKENSNFEIFMSIINSNSPALMKNIVSAKIVLSLIFPDYQITIKEKECYFKKDEFETSINELNFESFKQLIQEVFCLKKQKDNQSFNPSNAMAEKIAEKIKRGREKVAREKGQQEDSSFFSQVISILSVGEGKDKNQLKQYTVYQLMDELERFELKQNFDMQMEAKLAGAKIDNVENWMKEIHL